MPQAGDEAKGMRTSKEAKNRMQCVSGRKSVNFTLKSEK